MLGYPQLAHAHAVPGGIGTAAAPLTVRVDGSNCGPPNGWLTTQGSWIVEASNPNCKVRLMSVTWYGFDNTDWVLAGLNFEPYQTILQEIHDLGFNSIRIRYPTRW